MNLPKKSSSCTICKRRGYTEWHHIISQHHAIRTGQKNLLENPDNLIELCKVCHDQTTASMVRKRLLREGKQIVKQPTRRKVVRQNKNGRKVLQTKKESRQQRKEREREERLSELERIEKSITNLELRGVFWGGAPYNKINQLINFLDNVSSEDELAEKWKRLLRGGAGIKALYPKDHWMYDEQCFDKSLSADFEKEGFCWTINGGAWRKDLSLEQAEFEIGLANLRAKQRAALEKLQRVAASYEETRRKRKMLDESIVNLENRGVFFSESPVRDFQKLLEYLKQVSENDDVAKKWIDRYNAGKFKGLALLFPEDHWLHEKEKFDQKMSAEFEEDGYCWTHNGGAWKKDLSMEQAKAEISLAKIITLERILIEKEEDRRDSERALLEKEKHILACVDSLTSRGVFDANSPVNNTKNLISYLKGTCSESEKSKKWVEYFRKNSFVRIYPEDHWLHNEEEFDSKKSKQFEKDGFCWTKKGGLWKLGLSMEQAKAEVHLAEVKIQQKAILEREQAKLDLLKAK
ncbi:MAG: HNH endonuclease [Candidatus Thalassarchaeaceae archaeon]